jgi:hypothetical protein
MTNKRFGVPEKEASVQSVNENATSWAAAPRIWMSMMGMKRPV